MPTTLGDIVVSQGALKFDVNQFWWLSVRAWRQVLSENVAKNEISAPVIILVGDSDSFLNQFRQ